MSAHGPAHGPARSRPARGPRPAIKWLLATHALALSTALEPRLQAQRVELVFARRALQRWQRSRLGVQHRVADGARLDALELLVDVALPPPDGIHSHTVL